MTEQIFTINSRKSDGSLHRTWQAKLLEETKDYWLFIGKFAETVKHNKIGVIRRNTLSYEYFWKDCCYNVFRFHEPNGEFRNFYCNISLSPTISGNVLDYVDLDVDVLVWKDLSYEILDMDEFEANSSLYNYSEDLKRTVTKSLNELLNLIDTKRFPFDFVRLKS